MSRNYKVEVLCRLDELPDEAVTLLPEAGKPAEQVLVLRSGASIHGFANRCPHFGVPLAMRQEHLIYQPKVSISCNNHYARFRWHDGMCEFGDCEGDALQAVAIEVIEGKVCLKEVIS